MAHVLTETDSFDATVTVPDDGDPKSAASVAAAGVGFQPLVNRTLYLNNRRPTLVIKNADESINTDNSLNNDAQLSASLVASATYRFRAVLFVNNVDTTAGFQAGMGGTAGVANVRIGGIVYNLGSNAIGDAGVAAALSSAAMNADGATLGAGNHYAELNGAITTTTAGTLTVMWAQSVSHAANTTLQRGSYLEVVRVT